MPRVTRIAGSFAIVMIVYWAYALLAVPWIEPPANLRPNKDIPDGVTGDLDDMGLAGLFPPGAWEMKEPKVLECDRATLLFQKYDNSREDGTLEITPCTIIFDYEGPAVDEAQLRRQSIILEAPGGAVLKFDEKLNLNRARVGRLVGGKLNGEVTIRSDWKEPGAQDDLRIVTKDIQLTEKTISTVEAVDFRWGPHFGRGRQMTIGLLTGPPTAGSGASAPNISGIESFELRQVERLHLDVGQTVSSSASPPNATSGSVPIEINCRGAFRFDAVGRVATFCDQVDVMKMNPSGPADQIACELLSLYFSERLKEEPAASEATKPAGSLDFVAERIEAIGKPVVVTAPSQKVVARGERLEYNMLVKTIALDGGKEVFLQQGPNEIHARSLYYKSAGEGRLGQMAAQGPGWLRGQPEARPDQQLEALWKDQLRVDPDEQRHRISLTGGAELKFQGAGQLQAKDIYFWLLESPPSANGRSADLHPHSMEARHEVHMNSAELSGKVDQLKLWFEEEVGGLRPAGNGPNVRVGEDGSVPFGAAIPGNTERVMTGASPVALGNLPPASRPLRRFEVVGRLLQARILLGGPQAAVSDLTIEDGVRFVELQPAQTGERPLTIRGDRLVAVDVTSLSALVTVVGKPAHFEGHGLGLTGSNINLNRGTNRLWIDGAGRMDLSGLPASGDLSIQGQVPAAASGGTMTVDWQHHMEFDGRTARFEQSVVAATPQQQLRTSKMDVQLNGPISFSQPDMQKPPQVETIQCYGGVSLENRSLDPPSFDQIHVADLGIHVPSGAINAGGPGWLNRVFRGSPSVPGGPPAARTPSPEQLNCLHVQFQKSITGNLRRRHFEFADQVQMAYAPVTNWNAMLSTNDPEKLGPNGVVVRCEKLSVAEMWIPTGNRRAIELEALGNTVAEGITVIKGVNTTFTATGHRITYTEAKSLLILEGDGRNDARLFRQLEPGGERSEHAARKISYWPNTNRLTIDGARSLEIGQPPGGNIKR